jgi:hypothetical protein
VELPPITAGVIYAYRLFEVAEEVDLTKLSRLPLPANVTVRSGRLSFLGSLREMLSVACLGVKHFEVEPGRWVEADTTVLLFEFGVAAACFQLPVGQLASPEPSRATSHVTPGLVAESLSSDEAARWVSTLNVSAGVTQAAREAVDRVLELVKPALDRPIDYPEFETYTLLSIQRFSEPVTIDDVLEAPELPRILLGEVPGWIPAASCHAQLLTHHYRYGVDDLCVIDWDAAVLIDPRPTEDVPDLVALALTQLLEFQRFDAVLDRELDLLYRWTSDSLRHWSLPRPGLARRRVDHVNRLLFEIGDFVDRSENAFQITEDAHYARIYRGAIERFQVPAWRSSVLRRQKAVGEVARTLYDRAQLTVSHFLEIVIIGLITFEIGMALLE